MSMNHEFDITQIEGLDTVAADFPQFLDLIRSREPTFLRVRRSRYVFLDQGKPVRATSYSFYNKGDQSTIFVEVSDARFQAVLSELRVSLLNDVLPKMSIFVDGVRQPNHENPKTSI